MAVIREGRPYFTSVEKMLQLGRSPAEYASCSKPKSGQDSKERVIGCGCYDDCPWRDGPKYKGVRIFDQTGLGANMRETVMACYGIRTVELNIKSNGGFLEVIAEEGETINYARGSERVAPDLSKGETVATEREINEERPQVVPVHPRDETAPGLGYAVALENLRKKEAEKQLAATRQSFYGKHEPLKDEGESVEVTPGNNAADVGAGGERQQKSGKGPQVRSDLGGPKV